MKRMVKIQTPLLRQEPSGAIRIGKSRVLLELVIEAFQDDMESEMIAQEYPTITLAEVEGVIEYYLEYCDEVDAYIDERNRQAEEVQQRLKPYQKDLTEIRTR